MTKGFLSKAVGAALVLTASVAGAQPVSYMTQYSCGNGAFLDVAVCAFGGVTLTFTGQALTPVTAPTQIDYGTVLASALGGSAFTFAPGTFVQMALIQTSPVPGQAVTIGTMSGTIFSNTQSLASITWTPNVLDIGPIHYTIENLSGGVTPINAPSTGAQTIRGTVVNTTTPEPATYGLMATGLVGLFGITRRRKATA